MNGHFEYNLDGSIKEYHPSYEISYQIGNLSNRFREAIAKYGINPKIEGLKTITSLEILRWNITKVCTGGLKDIFINFKWLVIEVTLVIDEKDWYWARTNMIIVIEMLDRYKCIGTMYRVKCLEWNKYGFGRKFPRD